MRKAHLAVVHHVFERYPDEAVEEAMRSVASYVPPPPPVPCIFDVPENEKNDFPNILSALPPSFLTPPLWTVESSEIKAVHS